MNDHIYMASPAAIVAEEAKMMGETYAAPYGGVPVTEKRPGTVAEVLTSAPIVEEPADAPEVVYHWRVGWSWMTPSVPPPRAQNQKVYGLGATGQPYQEAEGLVREREEVPGVTVEKVHLRVLGGPHTIAVLSLERLPPVPDTVKSRVSLVREQDDDWLAVNMFLRPGSRSTNGPGPICPWSNASRKAKLSYPSPA
jgi:hypothetical protein